MEIVNGTDQDAKVKVAGGAGIAPYGSGVKSEDSSEWPLLPAGGFLSHSPLNPPWTVCFDVSGRQVRKEVRHAAKKITLAAAGSAFRVDIE